MKEDRSATRLRIHIGECDSWQGKPLGTAIVLRARERGLAGATVLMGTEGFGAHSRHHVANALQISEDQPVVVELIDRAAKIEAFLPELEEMVQEGLMVMDEVQVVRYCCT